MHSTRRVLAGEQSRAFQLQVFETSLAHKFAIFIFETCAVHIAVLLKALSENKDSVS
jgi:hypothetical protein